MTVCAIIALGDTTVGARTVHWTILLLTTGHCRLQIAAGAIRRKRRHLAGAFISSGSQGLDLGVGVLLHLALRSRWQRISETEQERMPIAIELRGQEQWEFH